MDSSLRLLLLDIAKRGWPLFVLAILVPTGLGVAIAAGKSFPLSLLYVAPVFWTLIPFVLFNAQFQLQALPISKESIGRAIWIATIGACAASLVTALGIGGAIAFVLRGSIGTPVNLIALLLLSIGISGHLFAFASSNIARASRNSGVQLALGKRILRWFANLHFTIVLVIAALGGDSLTAVIIVATTGWLTSIVYFVQPALLLYWLPNFIGRALPSGTKSDLRSAAHQQPQKNGFTSAWPNLLSILVFLYVLAGGYASLKSSGSDFNPMFVMVAFFVSMSGMVGVTKTLGSLHVFRVLPISGTRLTITLLARASLPVCVLTVCFLVANVFLKFSPDFVIGALAFHVFSVQMIWPPFLLSRFGSVATISLILCLTIWALGGSAAIALGVHSVAWIGAPVLVAIGFLWTRHLIVRSTSTYRSRMAVAT